MQLRNLQKEVGENAVEHGWWETERPFGELIALCHSELSEALEEYRNGSAPDYTYYDRTKPVGGGQYILYKPEGIPSELADVIIRILDMCEHYGIDMQAMLEEKHEYNKLRPYKHGNKVI